MLALFDAQVDGCVCPERVPFPDRHVWRHSGPAVVRASSEGVRDGGHAVVHGDGVAQRVLPVGQWQSARVQRGGAVGEQAADLGVQAGSVVGRVRGGEPLLDTLFQQVHDGGHGGEVGVSVACDSLHLRVGLAVEVAAFAHLDLDVRDGVFDRLFHVGLALDWDRERCPADFAHRVEGETAAAALLASAVDVLDRGLGPLDDVHYQPFSALDAVRRWLPFALLGVSLPVEL